MNVNYALAGGSTKKSRARYMICKAAKRKTNATIYKCLTFCQYVLVQNMI